MYTMCTKGEIMKRLNFVALGLLLVFIFGFSVGCSKTDYAENEHIITIYKNIPFLR